jgi:hypothetical protein
MSDDPNFSVVEIKAFVPARDFGLSKQFDEELGFEVSLLGDALAYVRHGRSSFLLQDFYEPEHANNFMMHLMVADVEAWWRLVESKGIATKYGVLAQPPQDQPWGLRDFPIADPDGCPVAHRPGHLHCVSNGVAQRHPMNAREARKCPKH